jgi:hypothetical protein
MELEIKYLKGYLGTGLKMIFEGIGGRVIILHNLTTSNLGEAFSDGHSGMWLKGTKFKPLLRPLSSMTDDEQTEHRKICKDNPKYSDIAIQLMNFYYSKHFDIHNLIGADLAIDLNTLK